MEDIITIESAISETEQQIDSLSGELQHYDALVDYSTVNLTLNEVYKLSNVEEPVTGFGGRVAEALSSGWKNFVNALEGALVVLAYGWMWVLLLAAVVIIVCRVRNRKRGLPAWGKEATWAALKKGDRPQWIDWFSLAHTAKRGKAFCLPLFPLFRKRPSNFDC